MTSGQPKPRHPVAVYGRIAAAERNSKGRPYLRLADGRDFTVRIWAEHDSLLVPLAAGAFVLAVGTWDVWTPERGGVSQMRMFAEEHWQLAHWAHDAATGHSSSPACPPPLSLAQRMVNEFREAAATRKPAPRRMPLLTPRAASQRAAEARGAAANRPVFGTTAEAAGGSSLRWPTDAEVHAWPGRTGRDTP